VNAFYGFPRLVVGPSISCKSYLLDLSYGNQGCAEVGRLYSQGDRDAAHDRESHRYRVAETSSVLGSLLPHVSGLGPERVHVTDLRFVLPMMRLFDPRQLQRKGIA